MPNRLGSPAPNFAVWICTLEVLVRESVRSRGGVFESVESASNLSRGERGGVDFRVVRGKDVLQDRTIKVPFLEDFLEVGLFFLSGDVTSG
ncbi:hypothetical protein JTE90_025100 [Oedothorax gibbosus]|uniref:Uncharacterized protein n=1 Tax=Oedothorax gibbosus TaxID=931172 RepID=A0AAV6TNU2_9ARAC|nr:hypothetical protein JTE90_025100 [Oedothorax gibbosus]